MSYANPNVLPSGTTFAQFQAGRRFRATRAADRSQFAGYRQSRRWPRRCRRPPAAPRAACLPRAIYYVNFTETNGYGETTPSAEAGPITVAGQAAPTGAPTVVVSGTGGTLPAGVYRGKFTYVDSNLNARARSARRPPARNSASPRRAALSRSSRSTTADLPSWASGRNLYLTAAGGATNTEVLAFTGITGTILHDRDGARHQHDVAPPQTNTTTTNIPKITAFPALQPGNAARNIYLTPPNGGSGSEVLYYRESTAATFTFSSACPGSELCRHAAVNQHHRLTALLDYQLIRAAKDGNLEDVYRQLRQLIYDWNHGSPVPPGPDAGTT